ncbi:hypothetical protein HK097_011240 [Rhizophlyctis rosea]|uniref:Uncharacterized protein n=1 Tax=Rhizophlyctis rosea TaxID=64517 RepID=A0AAD5X385_9FUNG|nr:hypothetical protein HK097_011240 [Rhizophlyctis rosea]
MNNIGDNVETDKESIGSAENSWEVVENDEYAPEALTNALDPNGLVGGNCKTEPEGRSATTSPGTICSSELTQQSNDDGLLNIPEVQDLPIDTSIRPAQSPTPPKPQPKPRSTFHSFCVRFLLYLFLLITVLGLLDNLYQEEKKRHFFDPGPDEKTSFAEALYNGSNPNREGMQPYVRNKTFDVYFSIKEFPAADKQWTDDEWVSGTCLLSHNIVLDGLNVTEAVVERAIPQEVIVDIDDLKVILTFVPITQNNQSITYDPPLINVTFTREIPLVTLMPYSDRSKPTRVIATHVTLDVMQIRENYWVSFRTYELQALDLRLRKGPKTKQNLTWSQHGGPSKVVEVKTDEKGSKMVRIFGNMPIYIRPPEGSKYPTGLVPFTHTAAISFNVSRPHAFRWEYLPNLLYHPLRTLPNEVIPLPLRRAPQRLDGEEYATRMITTFGPSIDKGKKSKIAEEVSKVDPLAKKFHLKLKITLQPISLGHAK